MSIPTPFYLIDEAALRRNLDTVARLREASGARALLALKCFATWSVFGLMREYLDGTTSSSLNEVRLGAEKFGGETHGYSVAWSRDEIGEAAGHADKLIFNSIGQLESLGPLCGDTPLGLRLNPGVSNSPYLLADPARPNSRLGESDPARIEAVLDRISGVMIHNNCENRSLEHFSAMLDRIEARFGHLLQRLDWVSLGGGIYSSVLLENAVNEFAKLPGIGRRSSLRLVLHLLKQSDEQVESFAKTIMTLKDEIRYCKSCHNISDTEICSICSNPARDGATLCVVENIREVMAIESTLQFGGLYHVLGGIISPIDGIGPGDLEIASLVARVQAGGINEVILALSATMEGDTTNFYIFRKLQPLGVKVSIIARGVSVGDEIEYADEITLGRSILNRTLFDESYRLEGRR